MLFQITRPTNRSKTCLQQFIKGKILQINTTEAIKYQSKTVTNIVMYKSMEYNLKVKEIRAHAAHRICRILRFFGKFCDRNPENPTGIFHILEMITKQCCTDTLLID
jgi:hypothetical protein